MTFGIIVDNEPIIIEILINKYRYKEKSLDGLNMWA